MNDILLRAVNTYSKTLNNVGFIKYNEGYKIIIMSFIKDFIDKDYVDTDNVEHVNLLINCLLRDSCVFNDRFVCITVSKDNDRFTYTFDFRLN